MSVCRARNVAVFTSHETVAPSKVMRRRAWVGAVFAGLAALAACRSQNGESWARGRLSADGADQLRREAMTLSGCCTESFAPPTRSGGAVPYLPRPFVVFDAEEFLEGAVVRTRLVYHAMNARLAEGVDGAASVRGFVVLDREIMSQGRGRRARGHAEYDALFIDRATQTVTRAHARSPAELESMLSTLPSSRP